MKQALKFPAFAFVLTTLVVLTPAAFGQAGLKITEIGIIKGKSKVVQPGCSQQILTRAFGRPVQMKSYNFEMDNKMGYEVLYDGADYYFEDNKLIGFVISKPGFNITLGHPQVITGVGKSIAGLPQGFTTKCRDNKCAKVYDLKRADNVTTDTFLAYDYGNSNRKAIKKIVWGEP
ncbi:MAG: hypothetical protein NVSMB24_12170 [Mucilaginibacter sp.]